MSGTVAALSPAAIRQTTFRRDRPAAPDVCLTGGTCVLGVADAMLPVRT